MRRMHKKGADISITVIIVAAIALIVFVVLIAIFTGRIGIFSKGLEEGNKCSNLGGLCFTSCGTGDVEVLGATCVGDNSMGGGSSPEQQRAAKCCKPRTQ